MKQSNTGLIECGTQGNYYVENVPSFSSPVAIKKAFVFDDSAKTALCKRFPQVEVAPDYEAIISDESIDLVLISAPSARHQAIVGAALKAKKHVRIV